MLNAHTKASTILKMISITNDMVIKETSNLHIILLNLKIEEARIKENTGIVPICTELERTIETLNSQVSRLVKGYRQELQDAMKVLEEYVKES